MKSTELAQEHAEGWALISAILDLRALERRRTLFCEACTALISLSGLAPAF
jgi:hypothetical protein